MQEHHIIFIRCCCSCCSSSTQQQQQQPQAEAAASSTSILHILGYSKLELKVAFIPGLGKDPKKLPAAVIVTHTVMTVRQA
jgi:hypothetical protein